MCPPRYVAVMSVLPTAGRPTSGLPTSGLPASGFPASGPGSPRREVTVERSGSHEVAELQDFVSSLADAGEPGLAVGIYSEGQLVRSATAGCAVPEHHVSVTEHTAFDIASVSKHMTSACLPLLARGGLVDLD